jgi:hypothetical protein
MNNEGTKGRRFGFDLPDGRTVSVPAEVEPWLLELKAVEAVSPLHRAQVITYLKLLKLPLGLLINFNSLLLKDGLERILNVPRRHP